MTRSREPPAARAAQLRGLDPSVPATPNRLLAEARGAVRDRLLKMGLMAEVGQERTYLSVGAGVSDFLRRWPPSPTAAEPPDPAATGVDAPPESPATGQ